MSKRAFLIFLWLSCSAAVMVVLILSREHLSRQQARDGQAAEAGTENSAEVPQPALSSLQSSTEVAAIGGSEQPQTPSRLGASNPGPPGQNLQSAQNTAPLQQQALPKSQPKALPNQETKRQAEVWSYPPLLQQNASNNFVRAMQQLANADTELGRYLALGSAAKSDFIYGEIEDAGKYARELLSLDEKFKGEPWRDGSAVYDGNLVLGRIAAQEGRMDEAKQCLLNAGKSPGSPVLGSFGPNMGLARDLLQSGERDGVLDFFDLCRKFWPSGDEKLTRWSDDVRAGRMPDFGANLLF